MFERDALKKKLLSFYDILALSCRVFQAAGRPIVLVTLLIATPFNMIYSLAAFGSFAGDTRTEKIWLMVIALSLRFVAFIFSLLSTMAIAIMVENLFLNKKADFSEAFQQAYSKWRSGVSTSLLALLIILGYTLLLIVPGVIWGVYYAFVVYVVILRNKTGKAALAYSKSLVAGRWGTLFVIYLGLSIVLGFIAGVSGFLSKGLPNNFFLSLIGLSLRSVLESLYAVAGTILFLNFELVKNTSNTHTPSGKEGAGSEKS